MELFAPLGCVSNIWRAANQFQDFSQISRQTVNIFIIFSTLLGLSTFHTLIYIGVLLGILLFELWKIQRNNNNDHDDQSGRDSRRFLFRQVELLWELLEGEDFGRLWYVISLTEVLIFSDWTTKNGIVRNTYNWAAIPYVVSSSMLILSLRLNLKKSIVACFHALQSDSKDSKETIERSIIGMSPCALLHRIQKDVEQMHVALRQQESKLKVAQAAKDLFVSTISHELRTPLHGIVALSVILMENAETHSDTDEYSMAKTIYSSASYLGSLVNNIIDYAQLRKNNIILNEQQFELNSFVEDIMNTIAPLVDPAVHLVSTVNILREIECFGDEIRLKQLLCNLLSNAAKFTHHGSIKFQVNIKNLVQDSSEDAATPIRTVQTVEFRIEDTGIGMSSDFMERMYGLFEQNDGSIQRRYGGCGLGLIISRKLVGLFQGDIQCESEVGVGTKFCIQIPLPMQVLKEGAVSALSSLRPSPYSSDSTLTRNRSALKIAIPACGAVSSTMASWLVMFDDGYLDASVRECVTHWMQMQGASITTCTEFLRNPREHPCRLFSALVVVCSDDREAQIMAKMWEEQRRQLRGHEDNNCSSDSCLMALVVMKSHQAQMAAALKSSFAALSVGSSSASSSAPSSPSLNAILNLDAPTGGVGYEKGNVVINNDFTIEAAAGKLFANSSETQAPRTRRRFHSLTVPWIRHAIDVPITGGKITTAIEVLDFRRRTNGLAKSPGMQTDTENTITPRHDKKSGADELEDVPISSLRYNGAKLEVSIRTPPVPPPATFPVPSPLPWIQCSSRIDDFSKVQSENGNNTPASSDSRVYRKPPRHSLTEEVGGLLPVRRYPPSPSLVPPNNNNNATSNSSAAVPAAVAVEAESTESSLSTFTPLPCDSATTSRLPFHTSCAEGFSSLPCSPKPPRSRSNSRSPCIGLMEDDNSDSRSSNSNCSSAPKMPSPFPSPRKDVVADETFHELNVLIVDDNAINRKVARQLLGRCGVERIDIAEDGKQGVDMIADLGCEHFDVIIMDLHMPVMDGREATREILRQWPDASKRPVIVGCSADTFEEEGISCVLKKPFTIHHLRDVLRTCIRLKSYATTQMM